MIRNKKWKWNILKKLHQCTVALFLAIALFFISEPYKIFAFSPGFNHEAELRQILQEEPILQGALIGVSVRSASTGELLFEHNGDIRMRPASNMKLFTAAAALSVLGEDYRFKTELRMTGKKEKGILKGDLYVKGYGDPTLMKADITQMVRKLAAARVQRIEGDLIGDDSWYDDVRLSKDLVWSDEYAYYGSQISALTVSPTKDYDAGTVIIECSPGLNVGDAIQIKISPTTKYIEVINQAVTTSPDGKTELTMEREHGSNTIVVKGFLPLGAKSEKEWIAIWEPTQMVTELFKQELANQGIQLMGTTRIGATPKDAIPIHIHQSIPLSKLLLPFMKLSNNGHAEVLIKEMGKIKKGEGSWEKGLAVLNEQLASFQLNTDGMVIRDGSGLSHINLVPPNEISKLLFHIQKEKWFSSFLTSLPVAGHGDRLMGGSLRTRMKQLDVQAKTGTLTTVSSLAGYVKTKNGETLIFSILLNNILDVDEGKKLEDKIVKVLANH